MRSLAIILSLLFISSNLFAQVKFKHTTSTSNITQHMTTLNNTAVNGQADKLLFVSHHYGKYDNHQVGVWYSNGKWLIYHEDKASMPAGTSFNVHAVKPSSRAFMHKATSSNIQKGWTIIDHPKCNNNPNAVLFITQNWKGSYNAKAIGVWYTGSRWAIYNQDRTAMPVGANFNVMVLQEGFDARMGSKVMVHKASSSSKQNAWGNYLSELNLTDKNAMLFITQNWKASGPYNNHIPAVWHGGKKWTIYNQDKKEIPNNAMFNVLYFGQDANSNTTTTANQPFAIPPRPDQKPAETTIKFSNSSIYAVKYEITTHYKNNKFLPSVDVVEIGIAGSSKSIKVPGDAQVTIKGTANKIFNWSTVFTNDRLNLGAGKTWCFDIETGFGTLGYEREQCN